MDRKKLQQREGHEAVAETQANQKTEHKTQECMTGKTGEERVSHLGILMANLGTPVAQLRMARGATEEPAVMRQEWRRDLWRGHEQGERRDTKPERVYLGRKFTRLASGPDPLSPAPSCQRRLSHRL